jgi:hypothetical protein
MSLILQSSGGGQITIQEPTTASNFTQNLPAENGTVLTTASTAVVTQSMLASNVVGNGPACLVTPSSTQSIPANVYTKVALNSELFDTNNNFNTTNNRFLPTVAGYYQISAQITVSVGNIVGTVAIQLVKTGTVTLEVFQTVANVGNAYMPTGNKLVYMNGTTDYLEVYAFQNGGSTSNLSAGELATFFSAALVRAA